jgi:hypothetical protein
MSDEEEKVCLQCTPIPHLESQHTLKGCIVEGCGCRLVSKRYIQHKSH